MEEALNYLGDNYYILLIAGGIILLAIIGYLADKKKSKQSVKINSEIRFANDIEEIKKSFKKSDVSLNQAVNKVEPIIIEKPKTESPSNLEVL